jgi:transcriptional regulator with XRE-family HTH domain
MKRSRGSAVEIGARVRKRRRELGLSQKAIAARGVTSAHISRIEKGSRTPSVRALRLLAPKLGVSVYWLETGEGDPAEELARLVLEHEGRPLPASASALARWLLKERAPQA